LDKLASMATNRYDIRVSLNAEEASARETAHSLLKAFTDHLSPIASASAIQETGGGVTVHFAEVPDEPPPAPSEYEPPREEDAHEAAGRGAIRRLAETEEGASALLPIMRALVAVSDARTRAGLLPHERLTIEVEPSPMHRQEELRHS
jgi:hypothetical protein